MAAYLVLARDDYEKPLEQVGTLEADDDDAARELSVEEFGNDWVELTLIPRDAVHWVLRKKASS